MLALLAMCCDQHSFEAMEEWCVNYQEALKLQVSFLSGHTPDAATFQRVFAKLDVVQLEKILCVWSHTLEGSSLEPLALDGKTIHQTTTYLVGAFTHQLKYSCLNIIPTVKVPN